MENLKAILEASGVSLGHVVKTTVYLKDMNDFAAMNEVYARYFTAAPPARSTVQAARLPKDALVEIDVVAFRLKRSGNSSPRQLFGRTRSKRKRPSLS